MKRRLFLGSLGALGAVPLVPSIALAREELIIPFSIHSYRGLDRCVRKESFTIRQVKSFTYADPDNLVGNGNKVLELDSRFTKRAFIEAKVLVDRWDLLTSAFVIAPSRSEEFNENICDGTSNKLWGADVFISEHVNHNEIIAMDRDIFEDSWHTSFSRVVISDSERAFVEPEILNGLQL